MSNDKPLPYGRQSIDETDIAAVTEALRGDWLTQGPRVERFEDDLRDMVGVQHAVAVSNGTAALHILSAALHPGTGDVSLVPAVTFVATANAVAYTNNDVYFVDVDPETGLLDLDDLAVTAQRARDAGHRIRACFVVDLCGQSVDMDRLHQIATRFEMPVLQDAAHALGATYQFAGAEHMVGSCAGALAATCSFHPIKHITTGEGGVVFTNDGALAGKLRELRSHGIHRDPARLQRPADDPWVGPWYYEQDDCGFNYRITDFQCALGSSQLRRLPAFLARRREIADRYDAGFAKQNLVQPLARTAGTNNAHHLYVVRVQGTSLEDTASRRRSLYQWLRDRKIFAQVNYIPVPWQPWWKQHAIEPDREYPGATAYYASCLSLPMYPDLTDADVDRVVDSISAWGES